MFLMDRFFDGEFLTFGLQVLRLSEEDEDQRIDPMVGPYYFNPPCAGSAYRVTCQYVLRLPWRLL